MPDRNAEQGVESQPAAREPSSGPPARDETTTERGPPSLQHYQAQLFGRSAWAEERVSACDPVITPRSAGDTSGVDPSAAEAQEAACEAERAGAAVRAQTKV